MSLSNIEIEFHIDSAVKDLILASSVLDEAISDSDLSRKSAMEAASVLIINALDSIQMLSKARELVLSEEEVFKEKPVCQVFYMENFKSRR